MSPDEVEALLRETRGPAPPVSLKRRVLEEVGGLETSKLPQRRQHPLPTRAFAAAAILAFVAVSAFVLHPVGGGSPSTRPQEKAAQSAWTYQGKELDPRTHEEKLSLWVTARESEVPVAGGPRDVKGIVATFFPVTSGADPKREPILLHAERGRLDPEARVLVLGGSMTMDLEKGVRYACSAARIDLPKNSLTMTIPFGAPNLVSSPPRAGIGKGDQAKDGILMGEIPVRETSCKKALSYEEAGKVVTILTGQVAAKIRVKSAEDGKKFSTVLITSGSARMEQQKEPRGPENRSMTILFSESVEVRLPEGGVVQGTEAFYGEATGSPTVQITTK